MHRGVDEQDDLPGGDSFLDVVANIVGILVLLVVVVGVRVGREAGPPPAAAAIDEATLVADATAAIKSARRAEREVARTIERAATARVEAELREQTRLDLATYNAQLRADLDEERGALDENTRRDLDTHNQLAQAERRLDELSRRQITVMSAAVEADPDIEEITIDPTPIVRERVENEVRLLVSDNRVTAVPLQELMDEMRGRVRRMSEETRAQAGRPALEDRTVGPIEGFSMRMIAQQRLVTSPQGSRFVTSLALARLEEGVDVLYEPADLAVEPGSRLMGRLAQINPVETVVTLHVYPDSFAVLPDLRSALEERGYRVATLPQEQGRPLVFGPGGRQTVLQ